VLAALDASRTPDEDREVVTLPLDDPGE
ncbi:MAG: hypothetical protein QOG35_2837, partial [Solirubrobacteraceae bacterium]|nr:hypothetical protein [Solirubrobacteraceae bacterium]